MKEDELNGEEFSLVFTVCICTGALNPTDKQLLYHSKVFRTAWILDTPRIYRPCEKLVFVTVDNYAATCIKQSCRCE